MTRIKEVVVSVTFMTILFLPLADSLFVFVPEIKNNENRSLKSKPKFDISYLDAFPEEYDEYYLDNFNLRNQFLLLNSKLKFQMFNMPPIDDKAILGRNHWMYLVEDQMDTYLGKTLCSEKKLARYYNIINYRRNFLNSLGCKYYIVVVPVKTSIYPEYLPIFRQKTGQKTLTDQFVNLLDTMRGLRVVDLRSAMKDAKGGVRMFHKTDNHWNEYGSYVAYEEIMKVISKDFPHLDPIDISNFKIDSVEMEGMGLSKMMGIYLGVYENNITCKPTSAPKSKKGQINNYPVIQSFGYKSEYEMVCVNDNDTLPKLLMIRDSFGGTVMPFLSEHFSKSVYIWDGWQYNLNKEIVLNEKPDIYIQIVVETFIPNIYEYAKEPN